MKKIVILALHLGAGGVEKTIATLSGILAKKYEVEIISNYQVKEEPAFDIDEKVKITYLRPGLKPNHKEFKDALKHFKLITVLKEGIKAIKILYLRRKLMIKAIKKMDCDIAISTRYIHSKLLGKYGSKNIIKIAQEHNNNGNEKYIKKVIESLKKIDYFMPVSKQLTNMYSKKLQGKHVKCRYIPHCLKKYTDKTSTLEEKNIISAGRLSKEKGFLDLIDVFEIVNKSNPDWHLTIAGDGQEREIIEEKIKQKKLENKIQLGFLNEEELEKELLKSSIYVMTSFSESFGLILIEAESFGLPLIAFDTAEGPKEIIEHGKNGFLIQNRSTEEMANKICELITNKESRNKIGQAARQDSAKYKMEEVQKIWYEFIDNI